GDPYLRRARRVRRAALARAAIARQPACDAVQLLRPPGPASAGAVARTTRLIASPTSSHRDTRGITPMSYAVAAPALHTLTVAGRAERFPVNRIFCVGRNYAAHAREMGKDPDREPPFFFMRPAQAAGDAAQAVTIPARPRLATSLQWSALALPSARAAPAVQTPVA